jgi:predicted amidohydrolase
MTRHLKIALAQYLHDCDPDIVVSQARHSGAEVVVFPELYSNCYAVFDAADAAVRERWLQSAVDADGPFIGKFRDAALVNRVHVVATLLEVADRKPFNSALLLDPGGRTVLHHRKVHICDFDSPENLCGRGDGFRAVKIETSVGTVCMGLMICMDREYPEAARSLSKQGAEIALVPNCCDLAADPLVGDVRIAQARGRAFETVKGVQLIRCTEAALTPG